MDKKLSAKPYVPLCPAEGSMTDPAIGLFSEANPGSATEP